MTTPNVQVVVEGFWCYTRSFNVLCHCRPSLNTGTFAIFIVVFRSRQNQSVVHWGLSLQQKDDSLNWRWSFSLYDVTVASSYLWKSKYWISINTRIFFISLLKFFRGICGNMTCCNIKHHWSTLDFTYLSACFSAVSTDCHSWESLKLFDIISIPCEKAQSRYVRDSINCS